VTAPVRTIVFRAREGGVHLGPRTRRSLGRAGIVAEDADLVDTLAATAGPLWLVRAGAWLARAGPVSFPPSSRTGRPLCALGAIVPLAGTADADESRWAETLATTGGDLDGRRLSPLPPLASVFLEPRLARALGERLAAGDAMDAALEAAARDHHARVVRYAPLDVHAGAALRAVQVVTSLQQGGAERVALSLATVLPRAGVPTLLVALGGPTRAPFPAPPGALDLSWERRLDREGRIAPLLDAVAAFGADVVHAHLLEGNELRRLSAGGVPLVVTIHNVREGWPAGTEDLRSSDAALLVGCASAVEAELREAGLPLPMRTVWNGIDFEPYDRTPERVARARAWRDRLSLGADDLVLVTVANPRPQKRLPLLPHILAATRDEMDRRGVRRRAQLVVVGGGSRSSHRAILEEVRAAAGALGVESAVHLAGSLDDVAGALAASDVMVSASAFEGLSLAHVEALASGLPLVATAVGGTPEVAHDNPAALLVAADATPETYATAIADVALSPPSGGREAAAAHFTLERMAHAYASLYPRAVAAHGRRVRRGLLLVTNNFSTGGAQSSARRLLLGLRDQGVAVRAAVLEEQEAFPTPGRRALLEAGIEVVALPPPTCADAEESVRRLLETIDRDPPEAVLLWNAMAPYKILLADALLDVPIFDVSPGEMYYESLARYLERPRPGLPYRCAAAYGARLAGVIVKYRGERERARRTLGAPVHVIPNGVVPLDGAAAGRPVAAGRPLAIGTLARLDPRKKVHALLDALARANGRMPPYVLRIGGGVERGCADYAAELRARANGGPVEWAGEVGDPSAFLRELDLFALVAEPAGCPNASLEAMAAGLPVVATDVGGMAEQIVEGVTGHVVPRDDPDALAAALIRLAHDGAARVRLGQAGRERIRTDFSLEGMVSAYRRVCLDGRAGTIPALPQP
jgi:glycosyltransferase involved in cell wall biosynthesis